MTESGGQRSSGFVHAQGLVADFQPAASATKAAQIVGLFARMVEQIAAHSQNRPVTDIQSTDDCAAFICNLLRMLRTRNKSEKLRTLNETRERSSLCG